MIVSDEQKKRIEQIVNIFETGTPQGKYDKITIMRDGPGGIKQITYGKSQTTEYGGLKELLKIYCEMNGVYKDVLTPYLHVIGSTNLSNVTIFQDILKEAANYDVIMREAQDAFFDQKYYMPALNWCINHNFIYPLSLLVVYDSFIHSGRIPDFLRNRYAETTKTEKPWVQAYVTTRKQWLSNHPNHLLRLTVYRCNTFIGAIAENNWDMSKPINANGVLL